MLPNMSEERRQVAFEFTAHRAGADDARRDFHLHLGREAGKAEAKGRDTKGQEAKAMIV